MYQYIIFDLDGTLLDSGAGIAHCACFAFEQLGLPVPSAQDLRKMVGPPLTESFPLLGVPKDQVEEAISLFREKYVNQRGAFENSVYPGIEPALQQLQAAGLQLFVATSKLETLAQDLLVHFGLADYFECVAGALPEHSRDSKADVLAYLLAQIGQEQPAVMVGDTNYDVIGARETGLPCICVSWGYGESAAMLAAGALAVVDSPAALVDHLTK